MGSKDKLSDPNAYYLSLIQHASFLHFAELMKIENPTKRKGLKTSDLVEEKELETGLLK